MSLWWLCFQSDKGICVVLQPAPSLVHARVVAGINKIEPGDFTEGHQLDAKTARKIPKTLIGKCLSPRQAEQLLRRLSPPARK